MKFICRKCSREGVSTACAIEIHGSTAFPEFVRKDLACVKGNRIKPKWEDVDFLTDFSIPRNWKKPRRNRV